MAERPSCLTNPGIHGRGVRVLDQQRLARDTYRLRIACPEIAAVIRPGQFVMLRVPEILDPLLGRAFALYDVSGDALEIVYLVHGKMTRRMAKLVHGNEVEIWGPLGNGFSLTPTEHLIMVAGGIGQTPFLALAKHYLGLGSYGEGGSPSFPTAKRVSFCYGTRSRDYLAGVEEFERVGAEVQIATDDGSAGAKGLVTDLLSALLDSAGGSAIRVCACGPEPMLAAVCAILKHFPEVPLEVSLETPMACGIGICFSCVAKIQQSDGTWDYRRTCVEGPVFAGSDIVW